MGLSDLFRKFCPGIVLDVVDRGVNPDGSVVRSIVYNDNYPDNTIMIPSFRGPFAGVKLYDQMREVAIYNNKRSGKRDIVPDDTVIVTWRDDFVINNEPLVVSTRINDDANAEDVDEDNDDDDGTVATADLVEGTKEWVDRRILDPLLLVGPDHEPVDAQNNALSQDDIAYLSTTRWYTNQNSVRYVAQEILKINIPRDMWLKQGEYANHPYTKRILMLLHIIEILHGGQVEPIEPNAPEYAYGPGGDEVAPPGVIAQMNAEAEAQEVPRVYVPYQRNPAFRTDEWYRDLCAKILEGGVNNEDMPLTDHAVNILTNHPNGWTDTHKRIMDFAIDHLKLQIPKTIRNNKDGILGMKYNIGRTDRLVHYIAMMFDHAPGVALDFPEEEDYLSRYNPNAERVQQYRERVMEQPHEEGGGDEEHEFEG